MNPPSSDRTIVVKVEVQLPWPEQPGLAALPRKTADVDGLSIDCPRNNGIVPVRVCTAPGYSGNFICAHGCAKDGDTAARTVYARVDQGTGVPPSLPPDGCWAVRPDQGTGNWSFRGLHELPGAVCVPGPSPSPANNNRLSVWADYGGTDIRRTFVEFVGVCSNHTDCCESISGTGSVSMVVRESGTLTTAAGVLVPLPVTIQVSFSKGTGSCARLTGKTVAVTWAPASRHWEGELEVGRIPVKVLVSPAGDQLRAQFIPGGGRKSAAPIDLRVTPASYQPLTATFTTSLPGAGAGKVTVTVTDE